MDGMETPEFEGGLDELGEAPINHWHNEEEEDEAHTDRVSITFNAALINALGGVIEYHAERERLRRIYQDTLR